MANDSSKIRGLIEMLWSLLLLGCMGLIVLPLLTALVAGKRGDGELIERTYTSGKSDN